MRLKNKTALITGGTSGIGEGIARLFASEGAHVIINGTNSDRGKLLEKSINEKGGEATFIRADITKEAEVEDLVKDSLETLNTIDILVNNAGISSTSTLHETTVEEWDRLMEVNVKGLFLVSKNVLPLMMERKNGNVINISSGVAEVGLKSRATYAATKGAILSLTKSAQIDYAPYNIRVNAILPGTIQTPFIEGYLEREYGSIEKGISELSKRQLNNMVGEPLDIAHAAVFLASDESKFIMGSPLYVDGGAVFCKG